MSSDAIYVVVACPVRIYIVSDKIATPYPVQYIGKFFSYRVSAISAVPIPFPCTAYPDQSVNVLDEVRTGV